MKTKEQILEKIMRRDARVEKTYTDPHDLASYLATIEERLEKVEGVPTFCATCKAYKGLQPTPTEVKDWEVDFDERYSCLSDLVDKMGWLGLRRELKLFIRNLLNK